MIFVFGAYTPLRDFFFALGLAAFVVEAWAFIDAIRRPAQAEQELIRNAYAKTVAEAQARSESIPFDPAVGEFIRQVALGMKERGELD